MAFSTRTALIGTQALIVKRAGKSHLSMGVGSVASWYSAVQRTGWWPACVCPHVSHDLSSIQKKSHTSKTSLRPLKLSQFCSPNHCSLFHTKSFDQHSAMFINLQYMLNRCCISKSYFRENMFVSSYLYFTKQYDSNNRNYLIAILISNCFLLFSILCQ